MLFFLITCFFSYILFHHKSLWFWKSVSLFQLTNSVRSRISSPTSSPYHTSRMFLRKKSLSSKVESIDDDVVRRNESSDMSVLDLPELVIESILEKLTPEGLCRMATVCSSLRDRCVSDHIWDKHMKNKWGRIIGVKAFREYKSHVASGKGLTFGGDHIEPKRIMGLISTHIWPFVLIRSGFGNINKKKDCSQKDSVMAFYLALESGKFWFPAQVYNRENGHVGFMLSCYDAELSYDRHTDTFQARYPPHGRRASSIESGVTWDRIRASPVDTSPHDLHVSDCLNELKPGDQIEIQWRRNKEFPYGWWYGVVGHLETCDGNANYCRCRDNDDLVLEFNQYTRGSRWRTTTVNRRDHREEGNEADGFYGGIRMIRSDEEKSMWKKLWPNEILE